MPPFAIRIGSRVMMKAKAGAKATVVNLTGKDVWNIKWDDGKIRADKKSTKLKEEPRVPDAAPPASITIPQGKCRIKGRTKSTRCSTTSIDHDSSK